MHQKGALRKNTGETAELTGLTRDNDWSSLNPHLLSAKNGLVIYPWPAYKRSDPLWTDPAGSLSRPRCRRVCTNRVGLIRWPLHCVQIEAPRKIQIYKWLGFWIQYHPSFQFPRKLPPSWHDARCGQLFCSFLCFLRDPTAEIVWFWFQSQFSWLMISTCQWNFSLSILHSSEIKPLSS